MVANNKRCIWSGDDCDGSNEKDDYYQARFDFFTELMHNDRDNWEKNIDTELSNGRYRIPLALADLRKANEGLDWLVLKNPAKFLLPWQDALLNFVREMDEDAVKQLKQPLTFDITGAFGRNYVTPRGMTAGTLQNLMCVEGVVTKANLPIPKLLQSMHVRKHLDDGHVEQRDHRDATAFSNNPNADAMPTLDADGNELMLEVGLSVYKDYQKFNIQEAPEHAPPGQMPRSIEVSCEGDLADKIKPGDRVQVTGVYKAFPPSLSGGGSTNGVIHDYCSCVPNNTR